jgi:hypothetical protein
MFPNQGVKNNYTNTVGEIVCSLIDSKQQEPGIAPTK